MLKAGKEVKSVRLRTEWSAAGLANRELARRGRYPGVGNISDKGSREMCGQAFGAL